MKKMKKNVSYSSSSKSNATSTTSTTSTQSSSPSHQNANPSSTSTSNSSNNSKKVDKKVYSKEKLSLSEFRQKLGAKDDDDEAEPSRVLWVGNIGKDVTEEDLKSEFEAYGEIESVRILRDKYCAFVNFTEESNAKEAKRRLHNTIIGRQYISINYRKADPKAVVSGGGQGQGTAQTIDGEILNSPSRALWIGNVSEEITKEQLQKEFAQFGEIESIRILGNKRCAFVNYKEKEHAENALKTLQGKKLGLLEIKINFGKVHTANNNNQTQTNSHGNVSPNNPPLHHNQKSQCWKFS